MKRQRLSFFLILGLLAGCSTAVFHHTDPSRHVVVLDRQPVSVVSTATNQWEAWGGDTRARQEPSDNTLVERQIKAIEIVSGCVVTHSQTDENDARRLSATVECRDTD